MLLKVKSWTRNDWKYVKLIGILDYSTVRLFNSKFGTIEGLKQLKVDLRAARFIDSTGVFVLTQIINQCRENDIRIYLINIPKGIYEIFRILGLIQVYGDDTFDSLDIYYG